MDSPIVTSTQPDHAGQQTHVCFAARDGRLLYPSRDTSIGMLATLLKADDAQSSNQPIATGRKAQPFDFKAAKRLQLYNVYHSTCIQATKQAILGLGFKADATEDALDPLCGISWQDTGGDAAEDYLSTGNGLIEVVRDDAGNITGLHHLPAETVEPYVEDSTYAMHYRIKGSSNSLTGQELIFARFGEREQLRTRLKISGSTTRISEVIHLRQSTSLSRWWGYPRWLAATASIELMQALHQFSFDFFLNRGVPEFMLFIKGGTLDKAAWEKIEAAMKSNIGIGNSHKSMALNLPNMEMEVQVEKLAVDQTGDSTLLRDMSETLALSVVSGHGVPPLLAGILIPGKLGATNELPNALQAFQALTVGPMQKTFKKTFALTLGDPAKNGGLGLNKKSFELKRIIDEIDLGTMDTTARMRQTVPEARAQGRDLSAGLRKTLDELGPEGVLAQILSQGLARLMSEQDGGS